MVDRFFLRVPDLRRGRLPGSGAIVAERAENVVVAPATVLGVTLDANPAHVAAAVSSADGALAVAVSAQARWHGECSRCLEPVQGDVEATFSEPLGGGSGGDDAESAIVINGDTIDLTDAVREALIAALPVSPLCRIDCAGPLPDEYPISEEAQSLDDSVASEPTMDDRWGALAGLVIDDEDEG